MREEWREGGMREGWRGGDKKYESSWIKVFYHAIPETICLSSALVSKMLQTASLYQLARAMPLSSGSRVPLRVLFLA